MRRAAKSRKVAPCRRHDFHGRESRLQVYGAEWVRAFETFFNRAVPGVGATNEEFYQFIEEFTGATIGAVQQQIGVLIEEAWEARKPR